VYTHSSILQSTHTLSTNSPPPRHWMYWQDLKTLLEKGGNPNELEPATNASLLHWAAEKGCTDAVRLLIKFMADINIKDEGGTTLLMRACRKEHFDIVEILINQLVICMYIAWFIQCELLWWFHSNYMPLVLFIATAVELKWTWKQPMAEHHCMRLQLLVTVRWLNSWYMYTRGQMFFPEIMVDLHLMNWPSGGATKMCVMKTYHLHMYYVCAAWVLLYLHAGYGGFAAVHSTICTPLRSAWLHQFIKLSNHYYFGISWQPTDIWCKRLPCEEYNCCSAKYGKHCTKFSKSNLWLYNYRFQFGTQLTLLYLKISSYPTLCWQWMFGAITWLLDQPQCKWLIQGAKNHMYWMEGWVQIWCTNKQILYIPWLSFLMSRAIAFIWWHLGLKAILPLPVLRATRPNSGYPYRHRRRTRHSGSMKPASLLAQTLHAYAGNVTSYIIINIWSTANYTSQHSAAYLCLQTCLSNG